MADENSGEGNRGGGRGGNRSGGRSSFNRDGGSRFQGNRNDRPKRDGSSSREGSRDNGTDRKSKASREERGYNSARGKKDDWQKFFNQSEPDFSEDGWARRQPKKKK